MIYFRSDLEARTCTVTNTHKQMFPHLSERLVMLASNNVPTSDSDTKKIADNVALINAVDKTPILEKAEVMQIKRKEKAGEVRN